MKISKIENKILKAHGNMERLALSLRDVGYAVDNDPMFKVFDVDYISAMKSVISKHPGFLGDVLDGDKITDARQKRGVSSNYKPRPNVTISELRDRLDLYEMDLLSRLDSTTLKTYRAAHGEFKIEGDRLIFDLPIEFKGYYLIAAYVPRETIGFEGLEMYLGPHQITHTFGEFSINRQDDQSGNLTLVVKSEQWVIEKYNLHKQGDIVLCLSEITEPSMYSDEDADAVFEGIEDALDVAGLHTPDDIDSLVGYECFLKLCIKTIKGGIEMHRNAELNRHAKDIRALINDYPGALALLTSNKFDLGVATTQGAFSESRLLEIRNFLINSDNLSPKAFEKTDGVYLNMDKLKEMYKELLSEEGSDYEDKLHVIFSQVDMGNGQFPTPIQSDISLMRELLRNHPGVITNLVHENGGTDIYTLPVFKYPLAKLKDIAQKILSSKYISPHAVNEIKDEATLVEYGKRLHSYYVDIHRRQIQKTGFPIADFGLNPIDQSDSKSNNFRRPRSASSFQTNPERDNHVQSSDGQQQSNGVETYHLVTTNFGGVGEVLNMHYYVKATTEQAARLNRSYWLTEDEAIERLESIRHRIQNGPSQSRGMPTFRGPNFKDSVGISGRSLTIDLQDATELSVTEAVSSKGSMLIDIYEEHFGEDMIIIQTTDKTYYCRTINMTGVNNSQNLITFNDIVSVIPAGVSCTFGKRTVYGLDNNPEELTPKQVFRKMLELS